MAVSYEMPLDRALFPFFLLLGPNRGLIFLDFHDIIPNGYNLGRLTNRALYGDLSYSQNSIRDWLIGNITRNFVETLNVTNATTFTGTTSWASYTYETNIKYVPSLLQNTNYGINHNITVGATTNSVDGLVAILEVKITGSPPKSYVIFGSMVIMLCY